MKKPIEINGINISKKHMANITTKAIIILGIVGLLLIGGCSTVTSFISYRNREVELHNLVKTKQRNIENVYDAMWKIISQKAQISQEYKSSFDSIYTHIMSERYSKGDGALMKWIKESNPSFDVSLYRDLSNSIESQRTMFMNEQKELLDIAMQYNNLIQKFPGSLFLSSKEPIEVKLITSTIADNAIKTGKDDKVDLFKK